MKICVFGASGTALDEIYINRTENLGFRLAQRGHSLVFGGGENGLMGAAARGFTKGNGKITGILPEFFREYHLYYKEADEIIFTESMRDRKKMMEDVSDAFVVVPGGIGTYEEFFEVLTLKQLARHAKPIAIFNINGYYDALLNLLRQNTQDGFVREQTLSLYYVSDNINDIISYLENDVTDIKTIRFAEK